MIVPAATAPGNPGENTLLPDADREIENLGLKPKEIALDGGFGHLKSDAQVAGIEPERVFVSGRREPGTPRTKWGSPVDLVVRPRDHRHGSSTSIPPQQR